jgi:cell division septation protein DedD
VKPLGGEEANQPAEGVIAFSNHGQVPPKVEEGAEPPAKPKPTSELPAAPVQAKEGKPPAEAQAKGAPKPPTEREAEPARRASAEKGSAGPEKEGSEMTFYDTATGKREVPGLGAPSGSEDSEAGPAKPEETAPAAEASGPPLGADLLARHRAEKAAPPPDASSGEAKGAPSGAELLARHRAAPSGGNVAAPPPSNTYAVQVATMADRAAARALAERLAAKGFDVRIDSLTGATGTTLYVVRVGRYASEQEAQRDLDRLENEPDTRPFIKMN